SPSGSTPAWRCWIFHRHGRFRGDDALAVFRIHIVSCVAPDTRQIRFAGAGSFGDFSVDRRNVHTVCPRSAAQSRRFDDTWTRLGIRLIWRDHETDPGTFAPSKTGDVTLSRNGLGDSDCKPSTRLRDSVLGGDLAS